MSLLYLPELKGQSHNHKSIITMTNKVKVTLATKVKVNAIASLIML